MSHSLNNYIVVDSADAVPSPSSGANTARGLPSDSRSAASCPWASPSHLAIRS